MGGGSWWGAERYLDISGETKGDRSIGPVDFSTGNELRNRYKGFWEACGYFFEGLGATKVGG